MDCTVQKQLPRGQLFQGDLSDSTGSNWFVPFQRAVAITFNNTAANVHISSAAYTHPTAGAQFTEEDVKTNRGLELQNQNPAGGRTPVPPGGDTSDTQKKRDFKVLPNLSGLQEFSHEEAAADIHRDAASECSTFPPGGAQGDICLPTPREMVCPGPPVSQAEAGNQTQKAPVHISRKERVDSLQHRYGSNHLETEECHCKVAISELSCYSVGNTDQVQKKRGME
ncbi:hypothetical protein P7K49_012697 [Saguinus oedipus]|uniref:Uncharacterized protein n=1 Tax=Saguinus oedipus TaxID=9490 RepID=A0ABQ9VE80_SAGOE|nr:hypothetical protein P7K49_012697 [Saguinus oedipus]